MRSSVSIFVRGFVAALCLLFCAVTAMALGATYEVGPGKAYANIGDVPWEELQAGDTVLIYWRETPYKEKWVIGRQGLAAAPITVRGVLGPNGELPVIDGDGATTRPSLNYWNEVRGLIKIGGASVPADTMPQHITLENLDLRSARTGYSFTSASRTQQSYTDNAAAIYIEKGEHITVRNCTIHDSGNGIFISTSDDAPSRNITIEGCRIYDNGIESSYYQHNVYTEAVGITYQWNYFGPLRAGCLGNNLKDRSAALVVRYNWIEGGNRQLDLVEGGGESVLNGDPRYRETHVYGNILIEPVGAGNRQIVHYGGDGSNTANYRKGTLYFYNNTIVSARTDRTTLFRLSTNEERCDARNNIFYVAAAGSTLSLLDDAGTLELSHNWFKPGRVNSFGSLSGKVNDDATSVQGISPGFTDESAQDYRLAPGSACVNAGGVLNSIVLPANDVVRQYVKHQSSEARPRDGQRDIGAYELQSGGPAFDALSMTTTGLPGGTVGVAYTATLTAAGGVAPYSWSVASGQLPAGLSLDARTGVISGTPTSAGTAVLAVQVTDAQNLAATTVVLLTITTNAVSLSITTANLPSAIRYRYYNQSLMAAGGVAPYAWSLAAGSLPPGFSLNAATGTISGLPTRRGTWSFTLQVQDSQAARQSSTRTLSIPVR